MDAAMEAVPRCFQQELRKRPELQQFVKKRTRYLTIFSNRREVIFGNHLAFLLRFWEIWNDREGLP
jgi:hypothetical protein